MRDREKRDRAAAESDGVHFDVDGAPMLDVTEERDVLEEFKRVETVLETAGQEE